MTGSITGPDRAQPLPLYYQIYETLRAQLADGVWAAGEFLPPIPQLAARFSVSIVTIRQAIRLLGSNATSQTTSMNLSTAPKCIIGMIVFNTVWS